MNIHSGLNSKPSFKFKITYPQHHRPQLLNLKNSLRFSKHFKFNHLVLNLFYPQLLFNINNQQYKENKPSQLKLNIFKFKTLNSSHRL